MKKKFLAAITLAFLLFLHIPLQTGASSMGKPYHYLSFTDIPYEHWALQTIYTMTGKGIMSGYSDHAFRPEKGITGTDFSASLSLLLTQHYRDNLINFPFEDNKTLTRGEAAYLLYTVTNDLAEDHEAQNQQVHFDDVSQSNVSIPHCVGYDLMKGYPDNSFKPFKTLSRAEAAVILNNLDQFFMLKGGL